MIAPRARLRARVHEDVITRLVERHGPDEATALLVGDVVGKGLEAARRAAFSRTVFARIGEG